MSETDKIDINAILLKAHRDSFKRAFETAVRTGTALVFMRDGKLVVEKPPFKYVMVPIKKPKKRKCTKSPA